MLAKEERGSTGRGRMAIAFWFGAAFGLRSDSCLDLAASAIQLGLLGVAQTQQRKGGVRRGWAGEGMGSKEVQLNQTPTHSAFLSNIVDRPPFSVALPLPGAQQGVRWHALALVHTCTPPSAHPFTIFPTAPECMGAPPLIISGSSARTLLPLSLLHPLWVRLAYSVYP